MNKKLSVLAVAFAIVALTQPAYAQQAEKVRRIGFLSMFSQSDPGSQSWHKAFEQGLRDHPNQALNLLRPRHLCQR